MRAADSVPSFDGSVCVPSIFDVLNLPLLVDVLVGFLVLRQRESIVRHRPVVVVVVDIVVATTISFVILVVERQRAIQLGCLSFEGRQDAIHFANHLTIDANCRRAFLHGVAGGGGVSVV